MLAHLGRAGGAVQADHVDAQRLQRGQGRADLRAEQHRARRLDRHGADDGEVGAGRLQSAAGAQDGGLGLEQVLGRLHQEGVGAARDHALGVLLVGVAQLHVRGVSQGRQLGARSHRAQHPALLPGRRRELVGGLACDPRAGLGELEDPLGDVVLTEGREVRTEGVRLDAVDADLEIGRMDGPDDVRAGHIQDFVAAFEVLEVLECRVLGLEHRAHRPVGYDHSGGERFAKGVDSGPAVSGRGRQRGHGCAPWDATAVGFAPPVEGARSQPSRARRNRAWPSHGAGQHHVLAAPDGLSDTKDSLCGDQGRHRPIVFSIVEPQ